MRVSVGVSEGKTLAREGRTSTASNILGGLPADRRIVSPLPLRGRTPGIDSRVE